MMTQRAKVMCLILFAASCRVALAAPAAAFPPAKAAPYTAVYKITSKVTRDGKTETKKDTVTISVLGNRSSWKDGDGQVTIYDAQAKKAIVYGGKSKENVAQRRPMPATHSCWELGYQRLAADSSVPPKQGGKGKYGGESCTTVSFETRTLGKPELCVTDKGMVVRYAETGADGNETIYEAEKVTVDAPSPDEFEVPAGFQLKE